MFPVELLNAVEFLNQRITSSSRHEDGRVNSIDDEQSIIDLLATKYKSNLEEPPPRSWYDIKLFGHPINIKSTEVSNKNADNASAKRAVLYCFTECLNYKTPWSYFWDQLCNHRLTEPRNYYYIVLDKTSGKVYLQSLLTLARITSNGSNLPFQIPWIHNLEPINRTVDESFKFIISTIQKGVKASIDRHKGYDEV